MRSDLNKKKSILNFDPNAWSVDRPAARPLKAPVRQQPAQQNFKPIPVKVPPVSPSQQSVPAVNSASSIPAVPTTPNSPLLPKKPKKKKGILIVAVILIVCIIGGLIYNNLCEYCHSDFATKYSGSGENICSSCSRIYELDCGHAEKYGHEYCYNTDDEYIKICSTCASSYLCDSCNVYYPTGTLNSDGNRMLCDACDTRMICYSCDEEIYSYEKYEQNYLGDYFHEDCYNEYYGSDY